MIALLSATQLTGLDESHLVELPCGQRLQAEVAAAFAALQADAREAGFDMVVASGFRSYGRQRLIWNGKADGSRPVYDDADCKLCLAELAPTEQLETILRYSAIPGTSRHHWGTDLDVYDRAAVSADYQLQLSPSEVAPGGVFDALHCWLDQQMSAGRSRGFYRPYAQDRGGVAPERWHLSYAPLSTACAGLLTGEVLESCWDRPEAGELKLRGEISAILPQILARYVEVSGDWCPGP